MKKILLHVFTLVFLLGVLNPANAHTSLGGENIVSSLTWNGSQSSDVLNAQNWTPAMVPGAGDDLMIVGGTPNDPILTADLTVASIDLNSTASFTIDPENTLTVSSSNPASVAIDNEGTFVNNGEIVISGHAGSIGLLNTGSSANFTSTGSFTCDREIKNTNGGTLQNDGLIDMTVFPLTNDPGANNIFINNGEIIVVNNHIYARGTFTNNGKINLSWSSGQVTFFTGSNNGTFINNDTINVSGRYTSTQGGAFTVNWHTPSIVQNGVNGVMNISVTGVNAAGIFLQDEMENYGRININSTQKNGIHMEQNGPFTNQSGGEIHIYSGPNEGLAAQDQVINHGDIFLYSTITGGGIGGTVNNNGTVHGDGSINGTNFSSPGTISPGSSPGVLTVENGLALTASSVYNAELEGTAGAGVANGHDQLEIVGTGNLNGTLNVSLISGFNPSVGNTFELISCTGGCSGTFSTVNLPAPSANWSLDYNANDVTLTLLAPLPVELIDFSAHARQGHTLLQWQTAAEENNRGFDIQRSDNGEEWRSISFVEGRGTTSELSNYTFTDQSPLNGTNYYRLKQIDFNGAYDYSEVVSVEFSKDVFVEVFPNPTEGLLFIQGGEESLNILLTNILGQLLLEQTVTDGMLDISNLPNGTYQLLISSKNQMYFSRSVIKK